MVVRCGYDSRWRGGGRFVIVLWQVLSKIKKGSEFRVSVHVHSVLGCTGSCGNKNEIMVTMTSQF